MKKRDELSSPNSCLNKAKDGEWLFVLLGRDKAAIAAVEAWIAKRIELGMNAEDDSKIQEARKWIVLVCDEMVRNSSYGRSVSGLLGVSSWIASASLGDFPGPFLESRISEARAWIAEVEQELRDASRLSATDVAEKLHKAAGKFAEIVDLRKCMTPEKLASLDAIKAKRLDVLAIELLAQHGAITVNELRAYVGNLPPLPGGDVAVNGGRT